jgi:hypothetical protein
MVLLSTSELGNLQQPRNAVQIHRLDQVQYLVERMLNHLPLRHVRMLRQRPRLSRCIDQRLVGKGPGRREGGDCAQDTKTNVVDETLV